MELKGVYPVRRSVGLRVETSGLGTAVLGTPQLTEEELRTVAEIVCVELRHRRYELAKIIARLQTL